MAEEKIIQSGQFTLPRLFFLLVVAGLIFGIVATGFLNLGYVFVTGALILLLILVGLDYGIKADKPEERLPVPTPQPETVEAPRPVEKATAAGSRTRKRTGKAARRRR